MAQVAERGILTLEMDVTQDASMVAGIDRILDEQTRATAMALTYARTDSPRRSVGPDAVAATVMRALHAADPAARYRGLRRPGGRHRPQAVTRPHHGQRHHASVQALTQG